MARPTTGKIVVCTEIKTEQQEKSLGEIPTRLLANEPWDTREKIEINQLSFVLEKNK